MTVPAATSCRPRPSPSHTAAGMTRQSSTVRTTAGTRPGGRCRAAAATSPAPVTSRNRTTPTPTSRWPIVCPSRATSTAVETPNTASVASGAPASRPIAPASAAGKSTELTARLSSQSTATPISRRGSPAGDPRPVAGRPRRPDSPEPPAVPSSQDPRSSRRGATPEGTDASARHLAAETRRKHQVHGRETAWPYRRSRRRAPASRSDPTIKETRMFSSADEVMAFIKKEGVKFVDVRFCDLPGVMQHFNVPAETADATFFTEGQMFDGSSIRGFQAIHESDMKLMPDISTAYLDPFRVEVGGADVRHEFHVRLVDRLEPADRRAVEHLALGEERRVSRLGGHIEVLHHTRQVAEPDVDELDALLLDEGHDLIGRTEHPGLLDRRVGSARRCTASAPTVGPRGFPTMYLMFPPRYRRQVSGGRVGTLRGWRHDGRTSGPGWRLLPEARGSPDVPAFPRPGGGHLPGSRAG